MTYIKVQDKENTVALVCPGTPALQAQVEAATRYLESSYGFSVTFQKDTYEVSAAAERAAIFLQYLFDPTIKGIWQLRGGEGCADILPYIEQKKDKIAALPQKFLIGFSDFTPILVYFAQQFHWQPIHGLCARQMALRSVNEESERLTLDWLFGNRKALSVALQPLNEQARTTDMLESTVLGGNLTLLDISIGDIWQINAKQRILLIEEVNEAPYRVARLLKYFKRIKVFHQATAVIFAGFTFDQLPETEAMAYQDKLQAIFVDFAADFNLPIFYTNQVGHAEINYPIPLNCSARLQCGLMPYLQILR